MDEKTRLAKERITQNNLIVSWIENFKRFLAQLVQESINILKKNTYKVEVSNPQTIVEVSNLGEVLGKIEDLQKAIESKKEFEPTDTRKLEDLFSQTLTCMQALPKSFPEQDDTLVVNELKSLSERFSGLVKAINDMPAPQATDMSKLESMMSSMSKTMNGLYDLEMEKKKEHDKMMNQKPVVAQEVEIPKLLKEGRKYNEDGEIVEYWEQWTDRMIRDIATISWNNGKESISWEHSEVPNANQ